MESIMDVQQAYLSTMYSKMKFPAYRFQEYPKWITVNGKSVLVQDQREELARISTTPEAAKNDPVVVEKNALAEQLANERAKGQALEKQLAELRAQQDKPTVSVVVPAIGDITTQTGSMASAVIDPSIPIDLPKKK